MAARRMLLAAAAAAGTGRTMGNPAEATGFDEGKVINLTPDNFDEQIKKLQPVLVDFYAPWCGHCKHLAPAYARAAEILDERFPTAKLTLAKLDSTTAPEVAGEYGVTGFPTMVLFTPDGKPENLKQLGPHNDVFIASHMASKLLGGHVVTQLDSADGLHEYRQQNELTCVLVAPDESKLVDMFMEAVDSLPVSYMTATADPSIMPADKTGTCTLGFECLMVFHASVPSLNRAVAHTELGKMDTLTMQAWMMKADIPQELRQGPFLSSWMQQIILVGSSEDTSDGGSIARNVFDYAAKGSSVYFSDEVLQTELAHKWILEAAQFDDNLQLPTMVLLDIEKGKVNQISIWGRSLTPAEGEDENAVVVEARAWAHDVTGLEPMPMDNKPKISESDLANNPHLAAKAKGKEETEAAKVIYDKKMSKKEQLEAAGHEIKLPEGKDLSDLTMEDFASKDEYHTWLKNRKKQKEADELAEQLHKGFSRGPSMTKGESFKMATGRRDKSNGEIAKERQTKEYVAVVEMCNSIGSTEGAKAYDKGKHKMHDGLDKFMNHVGIWYVNELRASDMVYTKGCGNESSDQPAEPHIRIVKGHQAKGDDPYAWETHATISTYGMDYVEIRDRLAEYGLKIPNKPHDEN